MLREDGWRLSAWHGGHRQYQHPVKRGTVTVSRTSDASLPRGALNSVLKQAGVASDASA
jgi:predicted RNA binding protein YcfA (HicA-like mRNA interferase family)